MQRDGALHPNDISPPGRTSRNLLGSDTPGARVILIREVAGPLRGAPSIRLPRRYSWPGASRTRSPPPKTFERLAAVNGRRGGPMPFRPTDYSRRLSEDLPSLGRDPRARGMHNCLLATSVVTSWYALSHPINTDASDGWRGGFRELGRHPIEHLCRIASNRQA